jgi:hypothetical protein
MLNSTRLFYSICNSHQREPYDSEGSFRPVLHTYQPRPEALDGTYVLPPNRRVE